MSLVRSVLASRPARALLGAILLVVLGGCGAAPAPAPPVTVSGTASPSASPAPARSPAPTTTRPSPAPSATSRAPGPSTPTPRAPVGLDGDRHAAFAFAPLDDPDDVTVEGRFPVSPAWSTSKVLVVAAFLDTSVAGRPDRLTAEDRSLVSAALQRSDADAVTALRDRIPGPPGSAMTAVLRAVGDTTTVAPDSYQGLMPWSLREQVRFMAALDGGRVVSPATSTYLLETMRPVRAHRWGLGTIGASAFKGGWLRADTATRQMGIVDGYAVALITDAGPAVEQTDGDQAHVRRMDQLARLLEERLAAER